MKAPLRNFALALLALLPAPAHAGQAPGGLKLAVPAPPVGMQQGAGLGRSVAVEGSYTVAGAPFDDYGAEDAGTVKVFDTFTGALLFDLRNPSPAVEGHFGRRVAISGSRIVAVGQFADPVAGYLWRAYVYDLNATTPTVPIATLDFPYPLVAFDNPISVGISEMRVVVGVSYAAIRKAGVGIAFVYDLASATPTVPVFTLNNPSPAKRDEFGTSVAISGMRVVVGALGDDTAGQEAGAAYVYDLAGSTPTVPVTTLNNPNPNVNRFFGWVVAIADARVVVGTPFDNYGDAYNGRAYVYDLNGNNPTLPVATLTDPAPKFYTYFAWNASISGSRIVIAAPRDNGDDPFVGSAYVFDLASASPGVPVATLSNPNPEHAEGFGIWADISGTRVVVGAYLDDTAADGAGSAYVYELSGGTPTVPVLTLQNTGPKQRDSFGYSVAVSGTLMVVGTPFEDTGEYDAGSVYVYDLGSATPSVPAFILNNPNPREVARFGTAAAISGKRLVIGVLLHPTGVDGAGCAYVYDLGGSTPTVPAVTLDNPSPAALDYFGSSVAISGSKVVVGTPKDDTGAPNAGRAYVFDLDGIQPTKPVAKLNNPNPAKNDRFGWSVAIFGPRIVVGTPFADTTAPNAGRAYVYNLDSATPTVPVIRLEDPRPLANDHFGHSVAVSETRVVVGVPNSDKRAVNSGSAYVYDLTNLRPMIPVATLTNPTPALNDNFGYSVAISGARIVVGAYRDDTGVKDAGSAYLFDMNSTTPLLPTATLTKPNPARIDRFGRAVAIDGDTIVVGTPNDDTTMLDKGAVYVFGP